MPATAHRAAFLVGWSQYCRPPKTTSSWSGFRFSRRLNQFGPNVTITSLAGLWASLPDQAQRHVDVPPAVEDREDRVTPRPGLRQQALGCCARLGADAPRARPAARRADRNALKLALQVFGPVAPLLHEQQAAPDPGSVASGRQRHARRACPGRRPGNPPRRPHTARAGEGVQVGDTRPGRPSRGEGWSMIGHHASR